MRTKDSALCGLLAPLLDHFTSLTGLEVELCHHADSTGTTSLPSALKAAGGEFLGTNICLAFLSPVAKADGCQWRSKLHRDDHSDL